MIYSADIKSAEDELKFALHDFVVEKDKNSEGNKAYRKVVSIKELIIACSKSPLLYGTLYLIVKEANKGCNTCNGFFNYSNEQLNKNNLEKIKAGVNSVILHNLQSAMHELLAERLKNNTYFGETAVLQHMSRLFYLKKFDEMISFAELLLRFNSNSKNGLQILRNQKETVAEVNDYLIQKCFMPFIAVLFYKNTAPDMARKMTRAILPYSSDKDKIKSYVNSMDRNRDAANTVNNPRSYNPSMSDYHSKVDQHFLDEGISGQEAASILFDVHLPGSPLPSS